MKKFYLPIYISGQLPRAFGPVGGGGGNGGQPWGYEPGGALGSVRFIFLNKVLNNFGEPLDRCDFFWEG